MILPCRAVDEFQMFQRLEVIACDGSCVNFEASHIALALLCSLIDIGVARLQPAPCAHIDVLSLLAFVRELQQCCQVIIHYHLVFSDHRGSNKKFINIDFRSSRIIFTNAYRLF